MSKHLLLVPSDLFPIAGDEAIERVLSILKPTQFDNPFTEPEYAPKFEKMCLRIHELNTKSVSKALIWLIECGELTANSKTSFIPITSGPINPKEIVLSERAFDEFCETMTVKLQVLQPQKTTRGSLKKTTKQQDKEITARHRKGESQNSLSKIYGVSRPTIQKIIEKNSKNANPLDGLGKR